MFKTIKIYKDKTIDLDNLLSELTDFGYEHCEKISEKGNFSHTGEIIDIFPTNFDNPVKIDLLYDAVESINTFDIETRKLLYSHDSLTILPRGKKTHKKYTLDFVDEIPIHNFIDLEKGDFVVHVKHGIGRFIGIQKLKERNGKFRDYIAIEYADSDKLYVPCNEMHVVQKYIGFEGRSPKLYKLGTGEWELVKEKVNRGVSNLAIELLQLQAMRKSMHGFSFSPDTDWQKEFESEFPYEETPGQIQAALEVKMDMESPIPMDRLICGDVGYGKTEVALRAAFKAVMDHKQVAMLVPTTILAEQHYNTFSKRIKNYPVNIQMLSRFKTESEQKAVLEGIADGRVDIVIGTHRLVSDDVRFKELGLVIIDEEQRFGVRHKEKLKQMRALVDILTLTATPVPRTLHMSLMGAKEMSIINTPPDGRRPVETYVTEYDEELIRDAILHEKRRVGQVYFIHNRVYDIDNVEERLKKLVPKLRVAVAHGQMHEDELEEVMIEFINGNIDVLIATTIIESGIDIPNVNTLIIDRADMFGLSDLYQLKGRVGRFKNKAYAYFLIPRDMVVNEESEKRLRAIEKFTDLGSGFKVAMEDLEIRGAGNILGHEQHGYIAAVGFDLYCKLLNQVMRNIGGN
jgi:transcription-repair coupling factor (superfamily II helicase)